jgi:hypothetical protein
MDDALERALCGVDEPLAAARYFTQGELVVLPGLLPAAFVAALVREAEAIADARVRKHVPGIKRSASVSWRTLRARAPIISALYRSSRFVDFVERVVDARLMSAPDTDPHACALYHYDRAGDRVGFHYDTSFYRGVRYTVLVGLVNDSRSKLVCELHRREPQRRRRRLEISTDPGTVVIFHGDKLWHAVSALGPNERRTVLTLQYVTDRRMSLLGQIASFLKDSFAYFGIVEVVRTLLHAKRLEREG